MTEQQFETARETQYSRDINAAQQMTDWFPDYLYGVIDAPAELPRLTIERLVRQFGGGDTGQHLEKIRDALMIFDQEHQANLASYFCGYPNDALKALEDTTPIEVSVEALDVTFPPLPEVHSLALIEELRAEREARLLERRQAALAKVAADPITPTSQPRIVVQAVPAQQVHPTGWRSTSVPSLAPSIVEPGHPLEWQNDALCAETDPEMFFPEKGGSTRQAKKICADCEVSAECLDYAMKHDETFGIWGGLSSKERKKYKETGILPARKKPKNASQERRKLLIQPFQRQVKRIEHFVQLLSGSLDLGLFDTYNEQPQLMARTARALLDGLYATVDDEKDFARYRRLEVYFLDKKWNRLQDEFGGSGVYWDLLSRDLTDVFSRTRQLREAFEATESADTFAEHYLQQGMERIETAGSAPSFTSVHVLRKPKSKKEKSDIHAQGELKEAKVG